MLLWGTKLHAACWRTTFFVVANRWPTHLKTTEGTVLELSKWSNLWCSRNRLSKILGNTWNCDNNYSGHLLRCCCRKCLTTSTLKMCATAMDCANAAPAHEWHFLVPCMVRRALTSGTCI